MTEEERKLLYDHTDSTNFKVTYCHESELIIKYLQLSEDDVFEAMDVLEGMDIVDIFWMLMVAKARGLQRKIGANMILGIQIIEPDFIEKWEEEL